MASTEQKIFLKLKADVEKITAEIDINKFIEGLGELIVQLNIKRIQDGYDIRSRKFGRYNVGYDKKEALKYAKKKYSTGKYSSTSKSDKLQLTGSLLRSLHYEVKKKSIFNQGLSVRLVIDTDTRNRKKAKGLMSTTGVARDGSRYSKKAWLFMGLAVSGFYVKKEKEAIDKYIAKFIQDSFKTRIKVK
jgi:hypothetical protein